jgi:hypothetical protein
MPWQDCKSGEVLAHRLCQGLMRSAFCGHSNYLTVIYHDDIGLP